MSQKEKDQTTQIALKQEDQWLVLRPDSEARDALQANMFEGEQINPLDLAHVKTPTGGLTTWSFETITGEESCKEITGIFVAYHMRGLLWPTMEIGNNQPLLVSDNLLTAYMVGDFPGDIDLAELEKCRLPSGMFDWKKLPWNQWGSGKDGIGKRCKEQRMMFILRADDLWPLVVTVQPGSLKSVVSFVHHLPVPKWRAIISLSLRKVTGKKRGVEYSEIVPKLAGTIDRERGEIIRKLYTDPLDKIASKVAYDAGAGVDDADVIDA